MNNDFNNNELHDFPEYVNADTPTASEEVLPHRINSEHFYHQQPKKKKSPFLTKKAAAAVLSLTIAFAGVTGFFIGTSSAIGGTPQGTNAVIPVAAAADEQTPAELTVAQIADLAGGSIVEINTEIVGTNYLSQQEVVGKGAGSGVIISADGYIVTNNHVIDGASSISVRLKNEQTYEAKLIGTDAKTDVAVLKVEAEGLTPVVFGDSDKLAVGDSAIAIGNPLGTLGGTVTNGIISALDRELTLENSTMNLLQTNAAINPGNSGGGLFNGKGELIGVVVAKSGGTNIEGLGFAIPVNDVKEVVTQLTSHGYVTGRADLGVTLVDIDTPQAAMQVGVNELGVYISKVEEGSSAQNIGFQVGDKVVAFNESEITSAAQISKALDDLAVGDTVQLTIVRGGQTASAEIVLGEEQPAV
ncbi:MAG: trypsin-like peptidase domain-containing protein [Christensenellaceae bacterium]